MSPAFRPRRASGLSTLVLIACASLPALTSCATRGEGPPPASDPGVNVSELTARAEELYAGREEVEKVSRAVELLRRARAGDYRNFEVVWKLAKFNYYLGEHAAERERREAAFTEGIKAGELAVGLAPERPEGHFWMAANRGGLAKLKGALNALTSVPELRRGMEKVIELDEGFQGGSAYMALAQIDLELPEMLGGDRGRALSTLEKGLPHGRENSFYRLALARAYYETGRKADARAEIDYILKMKPDSDYLPEYRDSVAQARRLLEKLN
jgi:tetratricopeptide (TPR) repeat protein